MQATQIATLEKGLLRGRDVAIMAVVGRTRRICQKGQRH